ncbi:MAG: HDOD domain-containing protein [Chloroflexota bacterium]
MINSRLLYKLESIREIPTIPTVTNEILASLDNPSIGAGAIAKLIEHDQSLTVRVLRVANSPFYGFSRTINTVELAIIIMGVNTIREIILSLVIQKFFLRIRLSVFDIKSFWQYTLFCGACSRLLARKLGYRLAGEAFIAGLMHDVGILIIVEHFTQQYLQIKDIVTRKNLTYTQAEEIALGATHCEIGAWLAERWNFPERFCQATANHHTPYVNLNPQNDGAVDFDEIDQPVTAIVSIAEWLAADMGFKSWSDERVPPPLYLGDEIFHDAQSDDIYEDNTALDLLKKEIMEEFERTFVFNEFLNK